MIYTLALLDHMMELVNTLFPIVIILMSTIIWSQVLYKAKFLREKTS